MWQDFTNKTFNKTILTGQSSLFSPVSSSTGVSLIFSVEYAHISSPRTLYSVKYSNAGHRLPRAAWSYLHNQVTVNTEENKGKFKNQFKSYVLNSKISTFPSIETLIILGVFVLFCYLFFFLFENKTVMKEKQTWKPSYRSWLCDTLPRLPKVKMLVPGFLSGSEITLSADP